MIGAKGEMPMLGLMRKIMPRCIKMIFSEIEPESKEKLAREMMEKMMGIFTAMAQDK